MIMFWKYGIFHLGLETILDTDKQISRDASISLVYTTDFIM